MSVTAKDDRFVTVLYPFHKVQYTYTYCTYVHDYYEWTSHHDLVNDEVTDIRVSVIIFIPVYVP